MMKKRKLIFICGVPILILIMLGVFFFVWRTLPNQKEEEAAIYNPALYEEPKRPMSVTDIPKKILPDKITSVEAILNQESGYEEEYEEFYRVVAHELEERGSFEGQEKIICYASQKALLYYDAYNNLVRDYQRIFLFSEKMEYLKAVECFPLDGKTFFQIDSGTRWIVPLLTKLKQTPDKEYLAIKNGKAMLLLDEDNQVEDVQDWYIITVEGDYYHALEQEKLKLSYQELTAEENLVKIEFLRPKEEEEENR